MITSLGTWRQQHFIRNRSMIGVALNKANLCMVHVGFRNGLITVGPWQQKMLSYSVDNHFLVINPNWLSQKLMEMISLIKRPAAYIAGALAHEVAQLIYLPADINLTGEVYYEILAQVLAKSSCRHLNQLLIAIPHDTQSNAPFFLVCEYDAAKLLINEFAQTKMQLVALDWQPLTLWRGLWFIAQIAFNLINEVTVQCAQLFLANIKSWQAIHFEALGAALNGLMYVEK